MPRATRRAAGAFHRPRFALHSGSDDPPAWEGDAKLSGRAEEVLDAGVRARVLGSDATPRSSHLSRLDLGEVSAVGLTPERDGLVVTVWTPADGVRTVSRG